MSGITNFHSSLMSPYSVYSPFATPSADSSIDQKTQMGQPSINIPVNSTGLVEPSSQFTGDSSSTSEVKFNRDRSGISNLPPSISTTPIPANTSTTQISSNLQTDKKIELFMSGYQGVNVLIPCKLSTPISELRKMIQVELLKQGVSVETNDIRIKIAGKFLEDKDKCTVEDHKLYTTNTFQSLVLAKFHRVIS